MNTAAPDIAELPDADLDIAAAAAMTAPETASSARSRLVDFYELTKPRMNFLVLVTATNLAAMFFLSRYRLDRAAHEANLAALRRAGAPS